MAILMDTPAPESHEHTQDTENDLPLDLDIWRAVCDQLDAQDIARLSQSSRKASHLIDAVGWPSLAHRYRLHHVTVDAPREAHSHSLLKYNFAVTKALRDRRVLAKQVGPSWDKGAVLNDPAHSQIYP
ncbi:hypothetical protein QFC19_003299 [Naganishia cerealis]|uniref:Uncharacterized protein n=1 Tax=Naganishia cerealis TaxID=610337 RepID=A0ACC2W3X8_9TREE|nr:hypothetical protein QFC19_003299 [Naganishia cerealis]